MDIGGIEDVCTGSRLLTAEDVAELTEHINRLESENAKLVDVVIALEKCWEGDCDNCPMAFKPDAYGKVECMGEERLRELGFEFDEVE